MNKKHLALISLIFFVCLIAFSCRRDIENLINDQVVTSQSLENARIWHAQHAKDYKNALRPIWADSWTIKSASGELLVVPAPELEVNSKDITIRRLFVFTLSGNSVSNGIIMEFLGEKYDVSKHLNELAANAHRESIDGFNGKIFKYDINYQYTGSAVFENGIKLEARSRLTNLGRKTSTELKAIANHDRDLYGKKKLAVALDFGRLANTTGNGETCTTYRITTEYYTNGVLTSIMITYETVCVPNPPSANSSGNSSANTSGSSSSGSSQTNPGYGGPTGGGTTVVNGPPPPPVLKDPCAEKAVLGAIQATTSVNNATSSIITQSTSTTPNQEYGSMIMNNGSENIDNTSLSATTPHSNGQEAGWIPPAFVWTPTLRTYGYTHYHPQRKAPSPSDVVRIIQNVGRSAIRNDTAGLAEYKAVAFVTAITNSGNYTVTIRDWPTAITFATNYPTNETQIATAYNTAYQNYLNSHSQSDIQGASVFALMEVFPTNSINIYKSEAASRNVYTPLRKNVVNPQRTDIANIDCPD